MQDSMDRDFREELYEAYVSQFKRENIDTGDVPRAAFARWATARYLPFLSHLPRNAAVLELGCGPGRLLRFLKDQGFTQVTGVDVSAQQTAIAESQGLAVVTSDIRRYLAGHAAAFDAIILIDVVEHFTKPELLAIFRLIHGSLRPGGLVLYQTVNGEGLFPAQVMFGDLTHMTYLTPGSSEQLLRAVGFAKMKFSDTGPVPVGVKGILRALAWRAVATGAGLLRRIETGKHQRIWTENFICRAEKA
ncbi:MAG: methyltransferase domain-containing protein [Telluria sp.]|nr:methyltransferase domain-containing protein [Telluria sp.]